MGKGILGGMFDFNNDGHMSSFERAAEFHFISQVIMGDDDSSSATDIMADTNIELDDDSEIDDVLADAGLDRDELMWMDEDERREALEEAGLDPMDFDDFD